MQKARELADLANLPIMAHLGPPPPRFRDILPYLKQGDIITHPYHGGEETILDKKGMIRPEYWEAKQNGIEVDLGLDRFHGNLHVMKAAFDQGFTPDYISTDLAIPNLHHITIDLPTTISKCVALGLPLTEALAKCTYNPAVKMKMEKEIGCLHKGGMADIAIFDIATDGYLFEDYFDNRIEAKDRILPLMTIRKGEVLEPISRETETWDFVFRGKKGPPHFKEK